MMMSAWMRCDILLTTDTGKRYIVEFVASDTKAKVKEHVETMDKYARAVGASEAWLVNFDVADMPGERESSEVQIQRVVKSAVNPFSLGVDATSGGYAAHAVHVLHDRTFRECHLLLRSATKKGCEHLPHFPLGEQPRP